MKKVKIMLISITVMAVVGGALAFKANKFNARVFCSTKAGVGKCTIELNSFSISPTMPGKPPAGWSYCSTTNETTANCKFIPIYSNE